MHPTFVLENIVTVNAGYFFYKETFFNENPYVEKQTLYIIFKYLNILVKFFTFQLTRILLFSLWLCIKICVSQKISNKIMHYTND